MKKKICKIVFGGLITFVAGTLLSGISLGATSRFSTSSNAVSFSSQKKQSLAVKQPSVNEAKPNQDSRDLLEIEYEYSHGTKHYVVNGFKDGVTIPNDYTLVIPKTYNNGHDGEWPVTQISDKAFEDNQKIKRVDCGNVEIINYDAFSRCTNLESVLLGENTKKLGLQIFTDCAKLKSLTIPECRNLIVEDGAFKYSGLEKIIVLCDDNCKFESGWLPSPNKSQGDGKRVYVLNENVKKKILGIKHQGWNVVPVSKFGKEQSQEFLQANFENGGKTQLVGLTTLARDKTELNIPASVIFVDKYAFLDCSENLTYITFSNDSRLVETFPNAFSGVPAKTKYRAFYKEPESSNLVLAALTESSPKIPSPNILCYKEENGFVKQGNKLSGQWNLTEIGGLTEAQKPLPGDLKITREITSLGAYALRGCNATKVTFESGIKLQTIDSTAFEGVLSNPVYYTNEKGLAQRLNNHGIDRNKIVFDSDQFAITLGGILTMVKFTNNSTTDEFKTLLIPKTIAGISLVGVGPLAFQNCSDINRVEFENGTKLLTLYRDSFKGLGEGAIIYAYQKAEATKIADKYSGTVGFAVNDFFCNTAKPTIILGLTADGRKKTSLHIDNEIGKGAFFDCASNLAEIWIGNNVTFHEGAIESIPEDIFKKVKFHVTSAEMKHRLMSQYHVSEKNISFYNPNKISGPIIGTIVGSICVAILALGLGIGIPMRKQHKINVLNSKLTHKRIDKLSAANAMAFKKVIEVTGNLDKKVDRISSGLKALKAASKITKPTAKKTSSITKSKATAVEKTAEKTPKEEG